MGRPTDFTPDKAAIICGRLADGESLRSICADDDMPAKSSVFRWLADPANQSFRDQYAHAREAQAEHYADEIIEIADESEGDFIGKELESGVTVEVANHENIARSRLRVDARKWIAAKLLPKKYGDRVIAEHDVSDPLKQLFGEISGTAFRPKTDGE